MTLKRTKVIGALLLILEDIRRLRFKFDLNCVMTRCQSHKHVNYTNILGAYVRTYQVDIKLFCENWRATIIYMYVPICRSIRKFFIFTVHPYVWLDIIVKPKTRKNYTKNYLKNLSEFISTFHTLN